MGEETKALAASAEGLMRARRYREAMEAYRRRLEQEPGDVAALLKLGICHLLDGSERAFVRIHKRAAKLIARLREVPPGLARLWARYQELFKKVTATALILGAVTVAAYEAQAAGTGSAHKYSGGVYRKPVERTVAVTVLPRGALKVDGKPSNVGQLRALLAGMGRNVRASVAVTVEKAVPYRSVVPTLRTCQTGRAAVSVGGLTANLVPATARPAVGALVDVTAKGELKVGGKVHTAETLAAYLTTARHAAGDEPFSVLIRPHAAAAWERVAPALAACAAAKLTVVHWLMPRTAISAHRYSGGVFRPPRPAPPLKKE